MITDWSFLLGQVMVGALNVKTAKPLPPELEKFVSASGEHGFIIVSFGTNVASLPKAEVDMLAEAFGKLKQRVVWRVKGNHGVTTYIYFALIIFSNWGCVNGWSFYVMRYRIW